MWNGRGVAGSDPRRPSSSGSSGGGSNHSHGQMPPHSPQDLAASALAAYTMDSSGANAAAFATAAYDIGGAGHGRGGYDMSPGGGGRGRGPPGGGGPGDATVYAQRAVLQRQLQAAQGMPGGVALQEQARLRAEMEMIAAMGQQRQQVQQGLPRQVQPQAGLQQHQQADLQQRRRELEQVDYVRRAQAERRARDLAEAGRAAVREGGERMAAAQAQAQLAARAQQAEELARQAAAQAEAEARAAAAARDEAQAAREHERKAKRAADQRARRQRIKVEQQQRAGAEGGLQSHVPAHDDFDHAAAFQDEEEAERSAFEAMGVGMGGNEHAGSLSFEEDDPRGRHQHQQQQRHAHANAHGRGQGHGHGQDGDATFPVSPMVRQHSAETHSSAGHQHQQHGHGQHYNRQQQHQQQHGASMHRLNSLDDGMFDDPVPYSEGGARAPPFAPAAEKTFPGAAPDEDDQEDEPAARMHSFQGTGAGSIGNGNGEGGGVIPRGYVGPDSDDSDDEAAFPSAPPPPPPLKAKPLAKAKPKKAAPKKAKTPSTASKAKAILKAKPKKKAPAPAPAQNASYGYPPVAEKTFPQPPVEPTDDNAAMVIAMANVVAPSARLHPPAAPPAKKAPLAKKKKKDSAAVQQAKKADAVRKAKVAAAAAAAAAAAKAGPDNMAAGAKESHGHAAPPPAANKKKNPSGAASASAAKKKKTDTTTAAAKKKSASSSAKKKSSSSTAATKAATSAKKAAAKKDPTTTASTPSASSTKKKPTLSSSKSFTKSKSSVSAGATTTTPAKKKSGGGGSSSKSGKAATPAKKTATKKESTAAVASTPASSSTKKKIPSSSKSLIKSKPSASAGTTTTTPAKKKSGGGGSSASKSGGGSSGGGAKSATPGSSTPSRGKVFPGSASSLSTLDSMEERVTPARGKMPTLEDEVPEITDAEYRNLNALMDVFCRVPLLAEFSRPVSLLHPELMPIYSKVVKHPVDLGRVCRNIRRKLYPNTRAVRLEMWRIFANCVKYHTHPQTRDGAVHSFVSIALHLRQYFNFLWQEYMLPSDHPGPGSKSKGLVNPTMEQYRKSFDQRDLDRKARMLAISTTILSSKCLEKTAEAIERFVESGGRVDELDVDPILETEDDDDYDAVIQALLRLKSRLAELSNSNQEFTVGELGKEVRGCYAGEDDILEDRPSLRNRFAARIDRLVGKVIVPIHETGCRGVNQSSIWGCMAAAIWSRESSKRPYWPAIVLGILAPEDQSEEWHKSLTERNENRLPEKLRQELQAGKRKAEQALRRQSTGKAERMSFFLVEFLGTHEFIWVREADIIENFDPDDDPNENIAAGNVTKKRKNARSHGHTAHSARLMQNAIEEGRWAMEEFEMQLNDTCGDLSDDENDGGAGADDSYSFEILRESDDEADGVEDSDGDDEGGGADALAVEEEITELLATEGLLDFSVAGRKKSKQRSVALKKQREEAKKAVKRRELAERAKKKADIEKKAKKKSQDKKVQEKKVERERMTEHKKEQKELERRRKKRARDRDRVLKEEERKVKKFKAASSPSKGGRRPGIPDKRGRATAIVRGYMSRLSDRDDLKGLGLSSVMNIPSATIETTGLLGMALAFRSAAGDITMPGSGARANKTRPWEEIDTNKLKSSEGRCKALEKQLEMLQGAVNNASGNNDKRRALIRQAEGEQDAKMRRLATSERKARKNHLAQRKKTPKKPDSAKSKSNENGQNLSVGGNNDNLTGGVGKKEMDSEAVKVEVEVSAAVDEEMHDVETAHASAVHDDDGSKS